MTKSFESFLIDTEVIDKNSLSRAKAQADNEGLSLDRAILKLGLLEEGILLPLMAEALELLYVSDTSMYSVDLLKLSVLTVEYCKSMTIAPIIDNDGCSFVLTSDPANQRLFEELSFHTGQTLIFAVAATRTIQSLLSQDASFAVDERSDLSKELVEADREILRQGELDGPVIRFVDKIFDEAVSTGVSDIHFESQEGGLRVRLRQNGILGSYPVERSLSSTSILARIKVMASMNVAERRLPQDGRITSNVAGRNVDFRVSSVPTSFGESIVCRVLDPKALRLGWDKLGFSRDTTQQIISMIEKPNGLFLVTGPTGSGKTTTLYTALAHLNQAERKILTVEDPIEYNLPGVEQVQVREEINMTFSQVLRSFLRQDPNIIMIGEIRDKETAEIACRAALVGRMVLSTLHTNSPEGAVTRLVDLGVPKYIVKDVLRGVLGQALEITNDKKMRLTARLIVT